MCELLIDLGDQGLAEFTAKACKRFMKSVDMHPLCRYLLNHLKAHQSFNLVVLQDLLSIATVRACAGCWPAHACCWFAACLWCAMGAVSPAASAVRCASSVLTAHVVAVWSLLA